MNPFLAIAIIAFAVAVTVTLMLLVRRFAAPAGERRGRPLAGPNRADRGPDPNPGR